ncbi:cbb3-type cytochrome c oxidase subunit 3 [Cryomorpha ignava]|uniref:Cbb3-type cytochrome c oxidase subunit 3 n=1 Tax=Cryomorpha ignava TaxID=101383 RepID=A0A7K3WQJ8_9FLAO|nr:cbb3-type cytochrome c oxidase subunit 3 [Cryomorpha ignava]NEN23933.1 cbb3-type cytochrome c oxidase subunit 3 [Cryomorpha ignava]
MLKFIKHNMESIIGIEIFPIISVLIFFLFFVGLIIYAIRMKQSEVDEISALPLNDSTETTNASNTTGHE